MCVDVRSSCACWGAAAAAAAWLGERGRTLKNYVGLADNSDGGVVNGSWTAAADPVEGVVLSLFVHDVRPTALLRAGKVYIVGTSGGKGRINGW